MASRREFVQKTAIGAAGLTFGAMIYSCILDANDRIRVGIVGFSDRFKSSLAPAFLNQTKELNFGITAISVADARVARAAVEKTGKKVQIGSF